MRQKIKCENIYCLEKALISVFAREYYQKPRKKYGNHGEEIDASYPTHKDNFQFQICKECAWIGHFKNTDIEKLTDSWIHLIPLKENQAISYKNSVCSYCSKKNVVVLFFKSPNEILGYFCGECKKLYCFKLDFINWDTAKDQGGRYEKTLSFEKIGVPKISPGFEEPINFIPHSISIPKKGYKWTIKILKKRGCQIS